MAHKKVLNFKPFVAVWCLSFRNMYPDDGDTDGPWNIAGF
jgi:hypothetical protein